MTSQWQPAPVVGGAYSDDARAWSVQDCVNWIPVKAERAGGRSPSMLRCAPGASVFSVPNAAAPAPVRGLHDVEGALFAVIGNELYQIASKGVAIPRGTIPGVGHVSMTHNQQSDGAQMIIATGSGGYVYTIGTATLTQITDDGFPGFKVCDYIDSYIAGVEPAGRFWFTSELADATSYNTLDRYEAESQPDSIVGLIVSHEQVLVLGTRTGEFFVDTGANTGTFQRMQGTTMEVGCAAAATVCKLDNSVLWLGNDGIVYRLNGYSPQRISTQPMEQAISRCDMSKAFAFTYEDRGHKIYYLTFVDGETWGYDVATQEWHRRKSAGLNRWRMNCMVRSNGLWIAGDFSNGKLYKIDWGMPYENGEVIERRRITGVLHENQNRLNLDAVELVFDTGSVAVDAGDLNPAQPARPTISGDAPDVFDFDNPYSYAYTVTQADAPIAQLSITHGELPPGLSISLVSGVPTIEGTATEFGTFDFTVTVIDLNGLSASVDDSIVVNFPVVTGQEWKFLQVPLNDTSDDYSSPSFDDSSWATAAAPFGGDNSNTLPFSWAAATSFDSRFQANCNTLWSVYSGMWVRRNFYIPEVPDEGLLIKVFIEDFCSIFINGTLVETTPHGHDGGTGQTFSISSDVLNIGTNHIAVHCDDDLDLPEVSITYFDLLIELHP